MAYTRTSPTGGRRALLRGDGKVLHLSLAKGTSSAPRPSEPSKLRSVADHSSESTRVMMSSAAVLIS